MEEAEKLFQGDRAKKAAKRNNISGQGSSIELGRPSADGQLKILKELVSKEWESNSKQRRFLDLASRNLQNLRGLLESIDGIDSIVVRASPRSPTQN